jgi:hypothetical protein
MDIGDEGVDAPVKVSDVYLLMKVELNAFKDADPNSKEWKNR